MEPVGKKCFCKCIGRWSAEKNQIKLMKLLLAVKVIDIFTLCFRIRHETPEFGKGRMDVSYTLCISRGFGSMLCHNICK